MLSLPAGLILIATMIHYIPAMWAGIRDKGIGWRAEPQPLVFNMTVEKRLGFFEAILDDYVDGLVQDEYYVSCKAGEFI